MLKTGNEPKQSVGGWQAALGELTFESEAADRLRAELRSAQEQAAGLQQQLHQSQQQVQAGQDDLRDARQAAADASSGTEDQHRLERQLQVTHKQGEPTFSAAAVVCHLILISSTTNPKSSKAITTWCREQTGCWFAYKWQ